MDVAAMKTYIQGHGFESVDDTSLMVAINAAYHEVCYSYPWEFLIQTASLVTTNGLSSVTTSFEPQHILALIDTTNDVKLHPLRLQQIKSLYPAGASGAPQFYYLAPGAAGVYRQINLFPTPNAAYSLEVVATRKVPDLALADLSNAVLIPSAYHEVIIFGALMRLSHMYDDTENEVKNKNLMDAMIQKMIQDDLVFNFDEPMIMDDFWGDWGF